MKKTFAIFLTLIMVLGVFSLAACKNKGTLTQEELENATAKYKLAYMFVQQEGVTGYALCKVKGAKEQFLLLNAPAKNEEDGTETPSYDLIRLKEDGTLDDDHHTLQFSQCFIDNKTGTLAIGSTGENGGVYGVLRYKKLSAPTLKTIDAGEAMPGTPVDFYKPDDLRGLLPLNEDASQPAAGGESTATTETTAAPDTTKATEATESTDAA